MPEQLLTVPPFSQYIARGCPTCGRGIEEGQEIALCPRCHTAHHQKCWFDQGGCGKVGCNGVASKKADDLGRVAAKSGGPNSDVETVTDPRASQLPLPLVIAIGIVVIVVAYLLFMR